MDADNSVVIGGVGWVEGKEGIGDINGNGKNIIKIKLNKNKFAKELY